MGNLERKNSKTHTREDGLAGNGRHGARAHSVVHGTEHVQHTSEKDGSLRKAASDSSNQFS